MIATEERRVAAERKLTRKEIEPYHDLNRRRLEDWLAMWSSSSKGRPKTDPDELITRQGFGPQFPSGLGIARLEALFSHEIRRTDRLLRGVVEEFKRKRHESYLNLMPIYFGDYASEGTLEFWRQSPERLHQLAFNMAENALDWMIEETEANMTELGMRRLIVLSPWATTRTVSDMVEAEQRYAVDYYYKMLELAQKQALENGWTQRQIAKIASLRTTEKTGYSQRHVRRLKSELTITRAAP